MALAGAGDFGETTTDFGLGDDQLRLTGLGALGLIDRLGNCRDIVTIRECDHIPTDCLEASGGVLALSLVCHGVE